MLAVHEATANLPHRYCVAATLAPRRGGRSADSGGERSRFASPASPAAAARQPAEGEAGATKENEATCLRSW